MKIRSIIIISTIFFCIAIGFDVSPYLRGPAYYPPEWRWEYLFQNTLSRVYLPLLVILLTLLLYGWAEKKKVLRSKQLLIFFTAAITLFFCFQLGVLYFSRSGITVLIHRIIDPEINGYFTAALSIQSVSEFLRTYNTIMLDFVYHAKAHPPGAILLFYSINQVTAALPVLGDWAMQHMSRRDDVQLTWDTLQASEKATVFVSSLFIPLLSALGMVPLYYSAKMLYGAKTATRSVFLFLFIPSLSFFIPINDAFLHIFSITAFCFFVYGLKKSAAWSLILSGLVLFLGIFFNLSLLPLLVLFFVYFLLIEFRNLKKQFTSVIHKGIFFIIGLLIPFILLFLFFQFNFIQVTMTIMQHVPDIHTRSYLIWIFYNLYDFFIFAGIPVMIIYFAAVKGMSANVISKQFKKVDPLLAAFTVMILILNFSGSVRGETGRIWIPYLPFLVLIVSASLATQLKFSSKTVTIVLALQALQILVMQEFWVMLW